MSEKKKFVRQATAPSLDDLEKTVELLNTKALIQSSPTPPPPPVVQEATKAATYSYTIKLEEDLEKRVEEATKKLRQTKKGFFLSAIEDRLEKLGF